MNPTKTGGELRCSGRVIWGKHSWFDALTRNTFYFIIFWKLWKLKYDINTVTTVRVLNVQSWLLLCVLNVQSWLLLCVLNVQSWLLLADLILPDHMSSILFVKGLVCSICFIIPSPTKLRSDIVTLPNVRPSILVNTLESTSFNGFWQILEHT